MFFLVFVRVLFFDIFVIININANHFSWIFTLWRHKIEIWFIHCSCSWIIHLLMMIWPRIVVTATILCIITFGILRLMWIALAVRWCSSCCSRQWIGSVWNKYEKNIYRSFFIHMWSVFRLPINDLPLPFPYRFEYWPLE